MTTLNARTCGSCTLCCKILAIDELVKSPGAWCVHCSPERGCRIYDDRPASCRQFACRWLTSPSVPEALKPSSSKVVLMLEAGGTRLLAHTDPGAPLAWRREPMISFLRAEARRGWGRGHVVARAGDSMWLVTPDAILDLGAIPASTPYRLEIRSDGVFLSILSVAKGQVVAAHETRLQP